MDEETGEENVEASGMRRAFEQLEQFFETFDLSSSDGAARNLMTDVKASFMRILDRHDTEAASAALDRTYDRGGCSSDPEKSKYARAADVFSPSDSSSDSDTDDTLGSNSGSDDQGSFSSTYTPHTNFSILRNYVRGMRKGHKARDRPAYVQTALDAVCALEDSHTRDGDTKQRRCRYVTFHFLTNNLFDLEVLLRDLIVLNARHTLSSRNSSVLPMAAKHVEFAVPVSRSSDVDDEGYEAEDVDALDHFLSMMSIENSLPAAGAGSSSRSAPKKKKKSPQYKNPRLQQVKNDHKGKAYNKIDVPRLCALHDQYVNTNELADIEVGAMRWGSGALPPQLKPLNFFSLANALRARGPDDYMLWDNARASPNNEACPYSNERFDVQGFRSFRFPNRKQVLLVPSSKWTLVEMMSLRLPHVQAARKHPMTYALWDRLSAYNIPQSPYVPSRSEIRDMRGLAPTDGVFDPDRLRPYIVDDGGDTQAMMQASRDAHIGAASSIDALIARAQEISKMVQDVIKKVPGPKRKRALWLVHAQWVTRVYNDLRSPYVPGSESTKALFYYLDHTNMYQGPRPAMQRVSADLPPMANAVAYLSLLNAHNLKAAQPQMLLLLWTMASMSSDKTIGESKGNVLLCGDAERSKSWLVRMAGYFLRIGVAQPRLRTSRGLQHFSKCSFQTTNPVKSDNLCMIVEEMPRDVFINQAEDGGAVADFKQMIETGECETSFMHLENGVRHQIESYAMVRSSFLACCNWAGREAKGSMTQRFFIVDCLDLQGENNNITYCMTSQAMNALENADTKGVQRLYHEMQAVLTELDNLYALTMYGDMDQTAAYLICAHVNNYLVRFGARGLCGREIKRVCRYAGRLCFLEWYASTYLLPGGVHHGKPVDVSHFRELAPFMFLSPDHVIHALGIQTPHLFDPGEKELRDALLAQYRKKVRTFIRTRPNDFEAVSRADETDVCRADGPVDPDKYRYRATSTSHPIMSCFARDETSRCVGAMGSGGPAPYGAAFGSQSAYARATAINDTGAGVVNRAYFDASDYDLNYVRFRTEGDPVVSVSQTALNMMNEMHCDARPTQNSLKALIKNMKTRHIFAHPMQFNPDDCFECVVPDTTRPKQSYPILQVRRDCVLVHYNYLNDMAVGKTLVLDALKDMFNHANEKPARYLYGFGEGATYEVIWLGPGHMPGRTDFVDDPVKNPAISTDLRILNPLKMTPEVLSVLGLAETELEEHDEDVRISSQKAAKIHTAETISLDTTLHDYVASLCMQRTHWQEDPLTYADLHMAMAYLPMWASENPVFSEHDIARFGPADGSVVTDMQRKRQLAAQRRLQQKMLTESNVLYQTPEDLMKEEDMDPCDHMIPNPYFDEDKPPNPYTNSERVVPWLLTGQTRADYKMTVNQRQMMIARHEMDYTKPPPPGRYPDYSVNSHKRTLELRKQEMLQQDKRIDRRVSQISATSTLAQHVVRKNNSFAGFQNFSSQMRTLRAGHRAAKQRYKTEGVSQGSGPTIPAKMSDMTSKITLRNLSFASDSPMSIDRVRPAAEESAAAAPHKMATEHQSKGAMEAAGPSTPQSTLGEPLKKRRRAVTITRGAHKFSM
jgi:hypothetical protein